MAEFTMLSGANPAGAELPELVEPVEPSIVNVQAGIPVIYGPDSVPTSAVRVVHPTNPNARSQHHSVGVVYVPPHAKLPNHFHEPEETFVVLKGTATLTSSNGAHQIGSGDFVYLPPWCEHAIENTGADIFSFLVVTAPSNP